MFKIITSCLAMGFSSLLFADSADEQALFNLLMPQKTLTANFASVVKNENGKVMQANKGKFSLKRPQQFRWETFSPEHTLVIADGKKVWNYDELLAQVTVSSLDKTKQTPAILLSGSDAEIKKLFNVNAKSCPKKTCFVLTPKKTDSELENIQMDFEGKNLSSLTFKDKLGFNTDIKFSQNQVNGELKDQLFRFTPPKGVDVVGAH